MDGPVPVVPVALPLSVQSKSSVVSCVHPHSPYSNVHELASENIQKLTIPLIFQLHRRFQIINSVGDSKGFFIQKH